MKKISKSGISLFVTLCMATGWISLAQESETAVSLSDSGTLKRSEAAEVLTKLFRILPQEPNKPIE